MTDEPTSGRKIQWRQIALFDFWFKFLGTSAFMTLFFWAYLYLLKNPAFPVYVMPLTPVDEWISFSPLALVPYLSLWIYCGLPVMLMPSRSRLVHYGAWAAAMCLLALCVFYWLPNAVPPAHIDWDRYPGVAFLKNVDAAGNACPSLHVAAAVFSSFWLFGQLRQLGVGAVGQGLQIFWGLAIVYSTIATRQHVFIDVLAGSLLGLAFASASWRADQAIFRRR